MGVLSGWSNCRGAQRPVIRLAYCGTTFGHRTQCRGDIVNCVALICDLADAVTLGRSANCISSLYLQSIPQDKVPASEAATSKVARLLLLFSHCSHSSLLLTHKKYKFISKNKTMAPALIETPQDSTAEKIYVKDQRQDGYKEAFAQGPKTTNYDNELKGVGKHPPASYPLYLPVWDNEKDIGGKYPPLEPFEAYEHGKDADPSFKNLLKGATSVEDVTANIGAEVKGVQLSQLDKAGKDELALFVAQKKVVGKYL